MNKGLKITITVVVVLAIVGVLGKVAYMRYKDKINIISIKKKKSENINVATPVAVVKAKKGSIEDVLSLTGRIYAHSEVNIFSTVPGKVKNILVTEGVRVKKDQILLYIDRSEAGLVYALTPVKSTINGIVKKVMTEEGAYIVPQNPLVQIVDTKTVEMVIHIPEEKVSKIKKGMQASIELISFKNRKFIGYVSKISPVLDPMSGTLEARISIKNSENMIKPGMFGSADIIIKRHKNAIIIPIAAIVERQGKEAVFIVQNGRADIRFPKFGIKHEESIEVINGIDEGQKVIVIGQQNLSKGDKVNITEEY